MTSGGYARPELLAETGWLAQHLDDPNVRVVDCEAPDAYNRAHIPGAVNVGTNTYIKGDDGVHVMPPDQAAEFMGDLGIGDDTLVVTYDNRNSLLAARFWWVLNYYGHSNVKALNGGWRKWMEEGRSMTDRPTSVAKAMFTPRVDPSLMVEAGELKQQIGKDDVVIWDVRSLAEYTGENDRGNRFSGHVPGAPHLEWTEVMDTEGQCCFRSPDEIRGMLEEKGITPEVQVYTY